MESLVKLLEVLKTVEDRCGNAVQNSLPQMAKARNNLAISNAGLVAYKPSCAVLREHRIKIAQHLRQRASHQYLAHLHLLLFALLLWHIRSIAITRRIHAEIQRWLYHLSHVTFKAKHLFNCKNACCIIWIQTSNFPCVVEHGTALSNWLTSVHRHDRQLSKLGRR